MASLGKFRLARALQQIAQGERQVEIIRQMLVEEPGYKPYALFKLLDDGGQGQLRGQGVTSFLKKHSIYATEEDVFALMRRYGYGASSLNYGVFLESLEPVGSPQVPKKSRSALSMPEGGLGIGPAAERLLVYKMKTEIDIERGLKVTRDLLSEQSGFSLHDAFRDADTKRAGHLSRENIDDLLRKSDVYLTAGELTALVRKMDKNNDGLISYLEFIEELLPLRAPMAGPPLGDAKGEVTLDEEPSAAAGDGAVVPSPDLGALVSGEDVAEELNAFAPRFTVTTDASTTRSTDQKMPARSPTATPLSRPPVRSTSCQRHSPSSTNVHGAAAQDGGCRVDSGIVAAARDPVGGAPLFSAAPSVAPRSADLAAPLTRKLFNMLDLNGDGLIDRREFQTAFGAPAVEDTADRAARQAAAVSPTVIRVGGGVRIGDVRRRALPSTAHSNPDVVVTPPRRRRPTVPLTEPQRLISGLSGSVRQLTLRGGRVAPNTVSGRGLPGLRRDLRFEAEPITVPVETLTPTKKLFPELRQVIGDPRGGSR